MKENEREAERERERERGRDNYGVGVRVGRYRKRSIDRASKTNTSGTHQIAYQKVLVACSVSAESGTPNPETVSVGSSLDRLEAVELAQVVLVLENVAGPLLNLAVLAHPNLLGHLADEAEVVADEHDATLEQVERLGQRVDGLDIQVVLDGGTSHSISA